jgi:RimJ/RimL family protein N-acetyltransferase
VPSAEDRPAGRPVPEGRQQPKDGERELEPGSGVVAVGERPDAEGGEDHTEERRGYGVLWELDGAAIGFSTAEPIDFGHEAYMHLHILRPELRRRGLGTKLVRLTARHYFAVLELKRLFCQPNALNEAPNRALQAAGFRYVRSHEVAPTPINPPQLTTLWVLER